MRLFRKEAEGGFTIADWSSGFLALCANGHSGRRFHVQYESCPCCRRAFDLRIEIMSLEIVAYNDGSDCQLEQMLFDCDEEELEFLLA